MEEKIKENIAYLEYKFAHFHTISNIGIYGLCLILDLIYKENTTLFPDIIKLVGIFISYLFIFSTKNSFNLQAIYKIAIYAYIFSNLIAYTPIYLYLPVLIFEIIVYIPTFLLFFPFNRALVYSLIIILNYLIGWWYYHFYGQNIIIQKNYIEARTIFIFIYIVIITTQIIYFLVQISKQKAVLNYIQKNEIQYDRYLFFNFNLHTRFGIKDIHSLSKSNSLEKLFETIEMYMKQTKPWLDPDYSIDNLARDLKSNTLYISQAVNLYAKTNFKSYLNDFRLYAFIAELENNKDKKLSFKEVYLDIGFNNHATFNRVFKAKFEMTPQEYMKKNLQN